MKSVYIMNGRKMLLKILMLKKRVLLMPKLLELLKMAQTFLIVGRSNLQRIAEHEADF